MSGAQAAHRYTLNDLFQHTLRNGGNHVGIDIARRQRVDGDAIAGAFLRQGFGEAVNARLGGSIVDLTVLAALAIDLADIDNPAEAAFLHALPNRMDHVEA